MHVAKTPKHIKGRILNSGQTEPSTSMKNSRLCAPGSGCGMINTRKLCSLPDPLRWAVSRNREHRETLSPLSCFHQGVLFQQMQKKLRRVFGSQFEAALCLGGGWGGMAAGHAAFRARMDAGASPTASLRLRPEL